jgi:hypothetical protein
MHPFTLGSPACSRVFLVNVFWTVSYRQADPVCSQFCSGIPDNETNGIEFGIVLSAIAPTHCINSDESQQRPSLRRGKGARQQFQALLRALR